MFTNYINIGIIDYFGGTLDINDFEKKEDEIFNNYSKDYLENYISEVKKNLIITAKEEPHIIRFFTIPNPETWSMKLFCVAKISNNGETFVFGDDDKFLNFLKKMVL